MTRTARPEPTGAATRKAASARTGAAALRRLDTLVLGLVALAINLLIALGLCIFVVALVGHLSFAGFFLEIGNLAVHYRDASPGQRDAFDKGLTIAITLATALVTIMRRRRLPCGEARAALPPEGQP